MRYGGLQEKIAYWEMPEELRGKYQYYTQADLPCCALPVMQRP